jgi:hypothetical protein
MKSYSPTVLALLLTLLLTPACSPSTTAPSATTADAPGPGEGQIVEPGIEGEPAAQIDRQAEGGEAAAPAAAPGGRADLGAGPMPEKFTGIYKVLKGATASKEPGNMAYNQHPEPTVALRWFGRYGEEAQVRVFALHGLGLYPTPENVAVLQAVAMDKEQPAEVRAGALRGLGRNDLEQAEMSEIKEFIFATAAGDDLVLAAAATDAMHGMPTARPLLLEFTTNPKTPAVLKAAAERALGPQVE